MKNLKTIFSICAVALMIASCKKEETNPDTRTYSFTISRNSSALANSSVSIATQSQNYTATTDNSGKCKINIPNSISLPTYTIVTIDHSSIKPYCLSVSGAQNAESNIPINCTNVPSIVRFRGVALHHLGNDVYGGSANSQLQLASEGLEKSFSYTLPATPGVMPRIQIYARGIEYPAEIYFNNHLTATLSNSASNGDLSLYDFQLGGNASTIFHTGSNIITIKTGATGLPDAWDDFEFCGVLLYYY